MKAGDIHRLVQDAFNAGDADALAALYEPDAIMATPDGTWKYVIDHPYGAADLTGE
jgi:hypothetical protein